MACGKPVVTTRHVEIPRIVEQILVDENDVHGLAEALERVYQSPSLRRELGQRNRELAEEHFSLRNVGHTAELLARMTEPKLKSSPKTLECNEGDTEAPREESHSQLEHAV
jgi:colanic acid/amylovoran biosynthesis glycosyltransferase